MKRHALFLLLLLAALMLTACHTDNDPWPTDGELAYVTAPPSATMAPDAEPAHTVEPTATPTNAPGGAEPGING